MNRFFVAPDNVKEKSIIIDSKEDIKHLAKVLRLKEGDEIEVSDGCEWEYTAVISDIREDAVIADITDKQAFAREPDVDVTLFQGIPKQTKMDSIVQKTVELGVKRIVPVFMDRTVVADKGNSDKKVRRWQKIAAESVKQCKRGIIPQIAEPAGFDEAVSMMSESDLIVFPYENEKNRTIKDLLKTVNGQERRASEKDLIETPNGQERRASEKDLIETAGDPESRTSENDAKPGPAKNGALKSVAVIIGPEGGFSETEAEKITAAGGVSVSLGKTILRTETAGPAAIAMIMYELEL